MPLMACPQCGQNVSSLASVCPQCSFSLREQRLKESQLGPQITCRKCGHKISAKANVCPHCGVDFPKRSFNLVFTAVPIGVVVVLLIVMKLFPGDGTTTETAAPPNPLGAEPPQITPPQTEVVLDDTAETETADSLVSAPPMVVDAPPAAVERTDVAVSPTTRWTTTWVNVRSEPRPNGPRVQILDPGVRVEVGGFVAGFWEVFLEGRRLGYVANSLLGREPPEP